MASTWTEHGPVSLPPRSVAYTAGAIIVVLAIVGLALGFRAASRQDPGQGELGSGNAAAEDATAAKPLVEFAPPVAAPPAAKEAAKTDAEQAQEQAAQTAAQAVQAKPSKPAGSIDEILTSPTEKPPAPVKPTADEAPPTNNNDVPF